MAPFIIASVGQSAMPGLDANVIVFIIFQFIGLVGAVVTLIAAHFSSITRQATWYNFMISWVVFCTSYLLLFLAGQAHGPQPPFSLCLIQSSLAYAAPPFSAAATLGLVLQLYFSMHTVVTKQSINGQRTWTIAILIVPYILLVSVFLEALMIALVNSSHSTFSLISYCSLQNKVPGRVTAALVIMLLVPVVVLNIIMYLRLRKGWSVLKRVNTPKSMFVRVTAFTTFGLIAIIAGLMFFFIVFMRNADVGLAQLNIVLSAIPVAAVLIFGTHQDLLQVWMFWKWKKSDRNCNENVFKSATGSSELRVMQTMTVDIDIH